MARFLFLQKVTLVQAMQLSNPISRTHLGTSQAEFFFSSFKHPRHCPSVNWSQTMQFTPQNDSSVFIFPIKI
jgi:hypothetical protein